MNNRPVRKPTALIRTPILYFAGFDLSLSSTGLVILNQKGEVVERKVIKPKSLGVERLQFIQNEIRIVITKYKPELVCIEGYAAGKNMEAYARQAELGGVVKLMLYRMGITYNDAIKPTQVKKFATGAGGGIAGSKDQVTMFVYKDFGFQAIDNNEADAYCIAQIALALNGLCTQMNKNRNEVLNAIKNPVKKPRKKKKGDDDDC